MYSYAMATLYERLIKHQHDTSDNKTFGLVLPGGGMRAVYSAGAISTLINYKLNAVFDHVVGVSAGAIHGAYFLANDNETMSSTYQKDLTNKDFVNLIRRDKKVDIDYMVDRVLRDRHPINVQNLIKSKTKLHVVFTDASTGKKSIVSDHKKFAEIYEEIRATAALPILYDKKVKVGDGYFIDGSVSDSLPIDVAINLGCTDIVVVLTQQISAYRFDQRHQRLIKRLIKKFAKNHTKLVRKKLPTDEKLLQINLRRISHPTKKIRFYVLQPSDEEYLVAMTSIDKKKIEDLGRLGAKDMDKFLNKEIKYSPII